MKMLLLSALALIAVIAVSAQEELYPPEYAPLFKEYRPITSDEAVAAVVLYGNCPTQLASGAKIFKPIAVKCINGLPSEYIVLAYKGEDPAVIGAISTLTEELNKDGFFDPDKVCDSLSTLVNNTEGLSSYLVSGWTWDGPVTYKAFGGEPIRIWLFLDYYKQMQKENRDIKGIRLYGSSLYCKRQIYCVKTDSGLKYYLTDGLKLILVDESSLDTIYKEDLDYYLSNSEQPESKAAFDNNRNCWERVFKYNIEEFQSDGYYRVREFIGSMDGNPISDVPDTTKYILGDGDCWAVALACCWAYWSEKYHYTFDGIVWNKTIPELTDHANSPLYAKEVGRAFEKYVQDIEEGDHLETGAFQGEAASWACSWTDGFGLTSPWQYDVWPESWELRPSNANIVTWNTSNKGKLPWLTFKIQINTGYPIALGFDHYSPLNGSCHAVPGWGYYTDSGQNYAETWDLLGQNYNVGNAKYYESDDNHIHGTQIDPPQGGIQDLWVSKFIVKKHFIGKDKLEWTVSDLADVKGFNVYTKSANGDMLRVNDDLIKATKDVNSVYKFKTTAPKDSVYLLELVRYTPDPEKYLVYPQGE